VAARGNVLAPARCDAILPALPCLEPIDDVPSVSSSELEYALPEDQPESPV